MTFKIVTFGCKVNSYESEYIKEQTLADEITLINGFIDIKENSKYEIDGYSFAVNVLKM